MAQYARPNSDVAAGSWTPSTGATLYGYIDEESYSDIDYIQVANANSTCEIGLSSVTDPESSSNHIVRYRARKAGNGALTVYLFDGATQIASQTPTLTTSIQAFSFTLSSGEADNISDYSDLRLKFAGSYVIVGGVAVSWAEFEVPDAGAPPAGARRIFIV